MSGLEYPELVAVITGAIAVLALIAITASRSAQLWNPSEVEEPEPFDPFDHEPTRAEPTWTPPPVSTADDALARDLALARAVQNRMSPRGVVRVPGFAVTGYNQMAEACGGDWWSCHTLPDGRLLIAVGDVTGHGLAAALVAVLARGIVEGVARSIGGQATPTRVIATLSASMDELGDDQHGMTCCVAVLDPASGSLDLASAGHPFPLVRRGGSGALEVITARGAPLGSSAASIGSAQALLYPGDMLLLCSDGLADRAGADGRRFGERRIRQLLSEHAPDIDATGVRRLRSDILAAVRGFAATTDADDDLTLVVCEYRERVGREQLVTLDGLAAVHAVSEGADTQRMFQRS